MSTIALVGCAHIHTPGFVKRLLAATDMTVSSIWDPDPAHTTDHAAALQAKTVASADAIFRDAAVDAVVICSETNRHAELVQQAVAAGKHLFVEKPLGMSAADAREMASAIEQAGVIYQTGYFMRGAPVHQFLRDHIRKGTFGKITRVRHSNCHAGSLGGWFDTDWRWMADPAIAGCGAFGDLGTHSLDIILWLLDNPVAATAHIAVATERYGDCDEYGEGLIRFADGAVASLAAGWVDVANPVTIIISGTEGHAHVNNGELFVKSENLDGADGEQPWTDLPEAWPHAFDLFLDALRGKADVPLVTPKEAALRNTVMEALYQGSTKQTWISI